MRLGLTLIYAEDFATMFSFYRDVLGPDVTDEDPGPGHNIGVDWAQFTASGSGSIELFDHAQFGRRFEFPFPRANAVVVTFKVDDLAVETARLRSKGVEFVAEGWFEWGGAAHFYDPEGNHLQLFRVRA